MDMSSTIAPKSDQLNSDDLISGPITVTITRVSANEGSPDQPVNIYFEGDAGKPYRPCKSMRRVMVHIWGRDTAAYVGRSMTLYRDPDVQFGGMKVGGTRISHMTHLDKKETMALTATRANRKPYTVLPLILRDEAPAVDAGAMQVAARAAAKAGTDRFRAWWGSDDGKAARDACKPILGELKALCDTADAGIASDPFGLPPVDEPDSRHANTQTDDELARQSEMDEARG